MVHHKVSASAVQLYLKGMHYPANKQDILNKAKANNAPENVLVYLENLPEREYQGPTNVQEEFGNLKRNRESELREEAQRRSAQGDHAWFDEPDYCDIGFTVETITELEDGVLVTLERYRCNFCEHEEKRKAVR
jgi:hypothetical protein